MELHVSMIQNGFVVTVIANNGKNVIYVPTVELVKQAVIEILSGVQAAQNEKANQTVQQTTETK